MDFNFQKLFKIPGMSLYFSDSWGTGSNLTATIGSVFPVNPNYAVGAYLGEIYLQQKLLKGNFTLAAGRLAANYTFAGLPVYPVPGRELHPLKSSAFRGALLQQLSIR